TQDEAQEIPSQVALEVRLVQAESLTPAKACSHNKGVFDKNRVPEDTPHAFYVDDNLYAEIYDRERIKQAIAANIEAIFILLGDSDLIFRPDPVSFDKLKEMMVNYMNLVLGRIVNTRAMAVQTPLDYIASTVNTLEKHWYKKRKYFKLKEIETLAGRLGRIADTAPWLQFLMAHVYTSISGALKVSTSDLITTNKGFRDMIKTIKAARPTPRPRAPNSHNQKWNSLMHSQPWPRWYTILTCSFESIRPCGQNSSSSHKPWPANGLTCAAPSHILCNGTLVVRVLATVV
ncbi:hypothetical protein ACHAWF_003311, partial [Thalassiosira exigua]